MAKLSLQAATDADQLGQNGMVSLAAIVVLLLLTQLARMLLKNVLVLLSVAARRIGGPQSLSVTKINISRCPRCRYACRGRCHVLGLH